MDVRAGRRGAWANRWRGPGSRLGFALSANIVEKNYLAGVATQRTQPFAIGRPGSKWVPSTGKVMRLPPDYGTDDPRRKRHLRIDPTVGDEYLAMTKLQPQIALRRFGVLTSTCPCGGSQSAP